VIIVLLINLDLFFIVIGIFGIASYRLDLL